MRFRKKTILIFDILFGEYKYIFFLFRDLNRIFIFQNQFSDI